MTMRKACILIVSGIAIGFALQWIAIKMQARILISETERALNYGIS